MQIIMIIKDNHRNIGAEAYSMDILLMPDSTENVANKNVIINYY